MATKVRKQVYLEPHQEALLKRLAAELGVTEAEIVRRAIEAYTRGWRFRQRNLAAWEEERAFIENLLRRGPVAGGRTWQREGLYAR